MTQFDIQDKERNKMTDAMMAAADREVIRLVQENRDAPERVIPTRKGFMRVPEIREEEPAPQVPMDEDRQLERMVNANTAWYRQQEQAALEEERARLDRHRAQDREEACRWVLLRRSTAAMAPALLGMAVMGGMAQGWAEPVFAGLLAAACFLWSLGRLRRVLHGGG